MPRPYVSAEVEQRIRQAAKSRCGYCLSPQHLVMARLEIEHIIPNWFNHFRWSEDGLRIIGLTTIGRATVAALHLDDDPDALIVRSYWVMAGWHPPQA